MCRECLRRSCRVQRTTAGAPELAGYSSRMLHSTLGSRCKHQPHCVAVPACARGMPPPLQSYYGAALCVCWSPDGAFVASGGEDDLVATYSVAERQVGQHRLQDALLRLCKLCPWQLSVQACIKLPTAAAATAPAQPPCWWKLSSCHCHCGPAKVLRANLYAAVCCAAFRWLLSVRVTTAG